MKRHKSGRVSKREGERAGGCKGGRAQGQKGTRLGGHKGEMAGGQESGRVQGQEGKRVLSGLMNQVFMVFRDSNGDSVSLVICTGHITVSACAVVKF